MTPYSVAAGYHRFGEPCCFHLQGGVVEAAWSFKTLVSYFSARLHNPEDIYLNAFMLLNAF
jgi:hypothetical protein